MNYLRSNRPFTREDLLRYLSQKTKERTLENIKIACVDDRQDFLEITRRFLELKGATVETWHDPLQALSEIDETFQMIISDYEMPGIQGTDLVLSLQKKIPGLKAIIASGRDRDQIPDIGVPILPKPWRPSEMERVIRDNL